MHVVMLAFPRMTQLDLTGPLEVFTVFKELTCHIVWKSLDPITVTGGLRIVPSATLETVPQADILFVPGGPGQSALMLDDEVLDFLRRQAAGAKFVTSVCTGSLLLGAAGLLQGHRATCHWMSHDQLALLGAIPVRERVVIDGNRVTGGGVTSGIDFALTLCAGIFGTERVRRAQLLLEYDPSPPFGGGSPTSADPEDRDAVLALASGLLADRERQTRAAAARLTH